MEHIFWPALKMERMPLLLESYREEVTRRLQILYDNIEHGEVALSECAAGILAEKLLRYEHPLQWDSVLKELL